MGSDTGPPYLRACRKQGTPGARASGAAAGRRAPDEATGLGAAGDSVGHRRNSVTVLNFQFLPTIGQPKQRMNQGLKGAPRPSGSSGAAGASEGCKGTVRDCSDFAVSRSGRESRGERERERENKDTS